MAIGICRNRSYGLFMLILIVIFMPSYLFAYVKITVLLSLINYDCNLVTSESKKNSTYLARIFTGYAKTEISV